MAKGLGKLGSKFGKLTKGKNKFWLYAAAAGGLLWYLAKKETGPQIEINLQPADVKSGQAVTIKTYRLIAERRGGMDYVPVQSGQLGGEIALTVPRDGTITRNFVQEENGLFAELR